MKTSTLTNLVAQNLNSCEIHLLCANSQSNAHVHLDLSLTDRFEPIQQQSNLQHPAAKHNMASLWTYRFLDVSVAEIEAHPRILSHTCLTAHQPQPKA